jgi:hypothetical protein
MEILEEVVTFLNYATELKPSKCTLPFLKQALREVLRV